MLPWKKSVFYTESKGFPSISLMQLCLGVKTLQSAVSVICQISYLVSNSNLNDPTTSPQAKALFGLNIAVSLTSFVMGLVMLLLKGSLMRSVKNKSVAKLETEVELHDIHDYTENPLRSSDQLRNTITQDNEDISNEELKTLVEVQQSQIKELKEEIRDKKCQIEGLKEEIERKMV